MFCLFFFLSFFLQVIQQNQQQFVQMLNDPEAAPGGGSGGGSSGSVPPIGGGGGGGQSSGQEFIQVTPEEKAAIERVYVDLALKILSPVLIKFDQCLYQVLMYDIYSIPLGDSCIFMGCI